MKRIVLLAAVALLLCCSSLVAKEDVLLQPVNSIVVPDRFLRSWDTVTIFFTKDIGPDSRGPEDNPERFVEMSPSHPGQYFWLDKKTLQFKPADSWPPLSQFIWQLKEDSKTKIQLHTLMTAPVQTVPTNDSNDLDPINSLILRFNESINPKLLAKMISIELRDLPGIDKHNSHWLNETDFVIKVIERAESSGLASYEFIFHEPIKAGTWVAVHFRLSSTEAPEQSFYTLNFATKSNLRITHAGCLNRYYPIPSSGVHYSSQQTLECDTHNRQVELLFSAKLADISYLAARNLIHISPTIENMKFVSNDTKLTISGNFDSETVYKLHLEPTKIQDANGNELNLTQASHLYFHFPAKKPFLDWKINSGMIERYGPQMIPLRGRSFEKADIRIHAINALDRSFWPFSNQTLTVDESLRPPSPGEQANHFEDTLNDITQTELIHQIRSLGSPSLSRLVTLPLTNDGNSADFGIDIKPLLTELGKENQPGTYLFGLRSLDGKNTRSWKRIQITDLSLSSVSSLGKIDFFVTSINSGKPIANATVSLDGYDNKQQRWMKFASGETDKNGHYVWMTKTEQTHRLRRISVVRDDDQLTIDPLLENDFYHENQWYPQTDSWLYGQVFQQKTSAQTRCHIFTERPVYRPEHAVHIKGYIRDIQDGRMQTKKGEGMVVISGPNGKEWRKKVNLSKLGGFYTAFDEKDVPSGDYFVYFIFEKDTCGQVYFKKEDYRIPRFEVKLNGPDKIGLDKLFKVQLTADYYAGGKVSDAPIRWRVTQFPHQWTVKQIPGFYYSTDARFSATNRFESTPSYANETKTDQFGSGVLEIDAGLELTAQPRRYVIEATVTGSDDQTVTNTHQVIALPEYVVGVKIPRYVQNTQQISPEIVLIGFDGQNVVGKKINVRIAQRQWHSHLKAGDFSQGVAKYVTEVVDEPVQEQSFISDQNIRKIKFDIKEAGVYIITAEVKDTLGRLQSVSIDLFAGGEQAVTWSKPPSKVFRVTADKKEYQPGEKATLVLQSPFQDARVLAILELPDGLNDYQWINVKNGNAKYEFEVKKHFFPRIAAHFLMLRGRTGSTMTAQMDLGKPTTIAASLWVGVTEIENKLNVELQYPEKAQPGDEIEVEMKLSDHSGKPVEGELTLWLVDQAVLALGKEHPLDPLTDFIVTQNSQIYINDTRNLLIGYIPFQEDPSGGGIMARERESLLDKVTIRQNFTPVPYYNPLIAIDKSGTAKVRIKLPDNLTNFKIRAKAVNGQDRFGYAKGHLSVRLPVIVQPALPRFVRPGDKFKALAIGRIVEGDGGDGSVEIRLNGLEIQGDVKSEFQWTSSKPQRFEFDLHVPNSAIASDASTPKEVSVSVAVQRVKDKASDAFSLKLPIRPDRKETVVSDLFKIEKGEENILLSIEDKYRNGTLRRNMTISQDPSLLKISAGLDYLMAYPYGCTEQRISKSRSVIAAKKLNPVFAEKFKAHFQHTVNDTLQWIELSVDKQNRISYWPGSDGNITLTAWAVLLMLEAQAIGFDINEKLFEKLNNTLLQSLRQGYQHLIEGEEYNERVWALFALARGKRLDNGYLAEMARRVQFLSLESKAMVVRLFNDSLPEKEKDQPVVAELSTQLWNGMKITQHQGKEVYSGLQQSDLGDESILPSEVRTLSYVLYALYNMEHTTSDKKKILTDALLSLGDSSGWGSTQANVAAIMALSDVLNTEETKKYEIEITGEDRRSVTISNPIESLTFSHNKPIVLSHKQDKPIYTKVETRYLIDEEGGYEAAQRNGFVVQRAYTRFSVSNGNYSEVQRQELTKSGVQIELQISDIVEEKISVVNPQSQHFVAIVVPLAAGLELLNPSLATAPPEAKSSGMNTIEPTYIEYRDDHIGFYFDQLEKGNHDFYFRTKASIQGRFSQPAAYSELMYNDAINGNSVGAIVNIASDKVE